MSRLWNWVDSKKLSKETKKKLFLVLNCLIYSALGFVVWLIVSKFALNSLGWALCFIGYAGFFVGYIGGFIYLCRK